MQLTGVLHMHSTHSYDGKLSLPELKELLVGKGMQFACMSEHTDYLTKEFADLFVSECKELSDESFVFVPGFEVPYKDAHVLHFGAEEFVCDFADANQLLAWRNVTPLVVLAHPVRNKFVVDETLVKVIDGVEIWNQQYDGKVIPRSESVKLLESLRGKKKLLAIGGLDFHRTEHFGSPTVTLEANTHNPASIIAALKTGLFTIGNESQSYPAFGALSLSFGSRTKSRLSLVVIGVGKRVSALLSKLGIKVPSFLRRLVRRWV